MKYSFTGLKTATVIAALLFGSATIAQTPDASTDPSIQKDVRAFLKVLNSGTGKPLEQLPAKDFRLVLVGAQAGVKDDLSGITVTKKTIQQDGLTVSINIVKPKNAKGLLPVFMFFHGGGWVLGRFSITRTYGERYCCSIRCFCSFCKLYSFTRSSLSGVN